MPFTESQEVRKKEVHDYLNENALKEKQLEDSKRATFGAMLDGPGDVSISLGEHFAQDALSLGKKKTWKPSDTQRQRNDEIDLQQRLYTKKATAYTAEIHTMLSDREAEKSRRAALANKPSYMEAKIALLLSIKFEKRMLTSANIRANLGNYLDYIDSFKDLLTYEKAGSLSEEMKEQLDQVRDQMSILSDRVESFLQKNRVDFKGNLLEEDEEPKEFVYTKEVEERFLKRKEAALKAAESKTLNPDTLEEEASKLQIDKEQLLKSLTTDEDVETLEEKTGDFNEMTGWTAAQRIAHLDDLKGYAQYYTNHIKNAEKQKDDFHMKPGPLLDRHNEVIAQYKRELIAVKACLILAEHEAAFYLETDEKAKAVRLERVREAEKDYMRVLVSSYRSFMPSTASVVYITKGAVVTKEEAINSESDLMNYEFKTSLLTAAQAIDSQSYSADPQVKAKVWTLKRLLIEYANCTHYSVGSQAESDLLKEILQRRKGFAPDDAAFAKVDELLEGITKTGQSIPDWNTIPDGLRIDALADLPAGKTVADLTDKELAKIDQVPKETKAGKQKGSHRNAILTGVSSFTNLGADTPLFAHEPTINDLRQGKVSNCYMLAATTGLINLSPEIIKDCIRDNGDGSVTVRLYKPSERFQAPPVPMFIRIPKRIPKLVTGGDVLSSGAVWMQLIERAAAQAGMFREEQGRSGYQSLWYGRGDEWLGMLTGASGDVCYRQGAFAGTKYNPGRNDPRTPEEIEKANKDMFFEELTQAKEKNRIFHAGTNGSAGPGMNSGHAYTVLGTKVVGKERFVILRNPYANMSRVETEEGDIVKSTNYTSSVADATCGQFAIPYDQFLKEMDTISVTDMSTAFRKEQVRDEENSTATETVFKDRTLSEIADLEKAEKARKEAAKKAEAERKAEAQRQAKAKKGKTQKETKPQEKKVVKEPDPSGILDDDDIMAMLDDTPAPVEKKEEKKDTKATDDDFGDFEIIDEFEVKTGKEGDDK